jgi:serine phosphatase RsbU (regulator of sigma subunit)
MVVRGATGDVEMFGAPGRPLGSNELVIGVSRLDITAGDRLVVYSDGVSELVLPGGRSFGLRRLKNALARRSGSPSAVRAELCRELEARRGDATLEDDITFVVVGLD